MSKASPRTAESGNVLFYILIAVALLAALSFAVAQSGRGSIAQMNEEKSKLLANEIMEYGDIIANAVAQLRLRGCKPTEISFENPEKAGYANAGAPADKTCNIFDPAGGGVTYRAFEDFSPSGNETYFRTGVKDVENTGLPNEADLWLRVISTDGSATSKAKQICFQINKKLSLGTDDNLGTVAFEPVIDETWADTDFTGTFPVSAVDDYGIINGLSAFCAGHDTDEVSYYRLILAR